MPDLAVLEFANRIRSLDEAGQVWQAFLDFVAKFGFTHGGLADMPGPFEHLEQTLLFLTWPKGWSDRYLAQNYVHEDPARLHLARTSEPYTWEEVLACPDYHRRQKGIVYEASEFKLRKGFIVPFMNASGGPAMVTIAGEHICDDPEIEVQIHLAALYAHSQIRSLFGTRDKRSAPLLSLRERECLHWAAAGKSDWEIGAILNISAKTAGTHIDRIKKKYGVATRLQAVVAGLRSGYVHT
jgi:DNA-binding CsgD family transcriptional regulator